MRHVTVTLILVGGLAVAGCGSDGSSDDGTPASPGGVGTSGAAATSASDDTLSDDTISDDTISDTVAVDTDTAAADALRAAATQHWADYKALDAVAMFEMQTDRCQLVNTLEDFEASFEFIDEEQLADLVITIGDVTVDGDRGEVAISVTRGDGEQIDTGTPGGIQPWLLVDGEWRQDDC